MQKTKQRPVPDLFLFCGKTLYEGKASGLQSIALNLAHNKNKLNKALVYWSRDTLNFDFLKECRNNFSIRFKGTVMQTENAVINDLLRVSKVSYTFLTSTFYNFAVILPVKFAVFLKNSLLHNSISWIFCLWAKLYGSIT